MRCTASRALLSLAVAIGLAGCEEPEVPFLETKGIDERLTERDVASVIAVLEAVGEKERPQLPFPFLSPPVWSQARTLPVSELLAAEEDALKTVWSPEETAERIPKGDPWDAAIRAQNLTREQFCALVLNMAAATGRQSADRSLSFAHLKQRGERELASLTNDERPFSSLTSDERHQALNRAIWLSIRDRADKLALVPEENVQIVSASAKLRSLLGEEYFVDPFAGLYPRPEDFGVPFDEGELSDADLTWSASNAVIGDAAAAPASEPRTSSQPLDRR